jgi:hypothetical protein
LPKVHPFPATALAAALLLAPSLALGTLDSHSSPHNLTWAAQFSEQFRAGILYPRWMPDSFEGLGAPSFYFYPPLVFWVDGLLAIATSGVLTASYRLSLVSGLLLWGSGLAMYAWLLRGERAERPAALIGALGYMAAPYHLFDHYVRGAIAELGAYALLPLVMLSIAMVADRRRVGSILLAGTYSALLLSHLPTALLISVTAVPAYVLFRAWHLATGKAKIGFLVRCLVAGILGLGLAAIYMVPAMLLQKEVSVEQLWSAGYRVEAWFLFAPQRWIARDVMLVIACISAAWCLCAAGAIAGARRIQHEDKRKTGVQFWACIGLANLVLMSGLAPWFWSVVPLVSKVQFAWRLLVVVEFSVITALCLLPWENLRQARSPAYRTIIVLMALTIGLIGSSIVIRIDHTLRGQGTPPQDVKEYLPAGYPQRDNTDYYDLGLEPAKDVPTIDCRPAPRLCVASAGRFGSLRIELESDAPTTVVLRRFFFPGWRLDPAVPLAASEPLRLVSFVAPAGAHVYRLSRSALAEEKIGWWISGASLVLLLTWAAMEWRGTSHRRAEVAGERPPS